MPDVVDCYANCGSSLWLQAPAALILALAAFFAMRRRAWAFIIALLFVPFTISALDGRTSGLESGAGLLLGSLVGILRPVSGRGNPPAGGSGLTSA